MQAFNAQGYGTTPLIAQKVWDLSHLIEESYSWTGGTALPAKTPWPTVETAQGWTAMQIKARQQDLPGPLAKDMEEMCGPTITELLAGLVRSDIEYRKRPMGERMPPAGKFLTRVGNLREAIFSRFPDVKGLPSELIALFRYYICSFPTDLQSLCLFARLPRWTGS